MEMMRKLPIALEELVETRGGIEDSTEDEPILATTAVLSTLERRVAITPLELRGLRFD